jgi:pimeloyl-ACP methyl ester carboxylesterase
LTTKDTKGTKAPVNDPQHMAPLAPFHGAKPPAPPWFDAAMTHEPERTFIEVEGAKVEVLAWGARGKPGLMLLHGGAAHADWWSFIAPFFAGERRVVAPTFTGMGRSDWRDHYVFEQFVREAREAGRAAGAFDAGPPVVVGHSFGGRVTMGFARDFGEDIAAGVMVDPPFFAPQNFRPPAPPQPSRIARPRASLAAVVARFRLMPPQPCLNPFILDAIARRSAREVVDEHGKTGFALCFDPHFWEKFGRIDPAPIVAAARAPMALVRGAKSQLFKADDADYLLSFLPKGSPHISIPEAEHHVMIDQPLAFVASLRALMEVWPTPVPALG